MSTIFREMNLNWVTECIAIKWLFKAASHMLCIGYGQAPPLCVVDMIVTAYSMLSGSLCFALMIAEITSLIQSINASGSAYKEKITQVKVNFFILN